MQLPPNPIYSCTALSIHIYYAILTIGSHTKAIEGKKEISAQCGTYWKAYLHTCMALTVSARSPHGWMPVSE